MPTILSLLIYVIVLTAPTPTTTPTAASSATNKCYCQTIPLKDWGK